ncbi:hypothetical protein GE061_008012 [Apolygus lucorum]|uniref:Reverse transcriptase domain-containing protein n=1 Tax=Apolygus lucorum TaxID=248454 RepID=A0A8S9WS94_APOLU|nr:hypothetical protein GE061_008012 [Apolygus lucorum]
MTDFSKAFDRLPHRTILDVLSSLGVFGSFHAWIASYLTARQLSVRVNGVASRSFIATSGVPQGSHLGPFLFNLVINGVISSLHCIKFLIYADDLKLFFAIRDPSDCLLLQQNLDALSLWCDQNGLALNPSKCAVTSFHRSHSPVKHPYLINGALLSRKDDIVDLGVHLDSQLSFSNHIAQVASRGMRALGFVKRNSREFTQPSALVTLYKTLVQPILEYASVIWSPYYNCHTLQIERVFRAFLRFLAYKLSIPRENIDYHELACWQVFSKT